MAETTVQLVFPGQVVRGSGALDRLGENCKSQGTKALVIGGKTALSKTKEKIKESLERTGVEAAGFVWYGGECCLENINMLADQASSCQADMIIAVGGGKALDTGKAAGAVCRLPVITVPTIAATCAAVTPLTVLYNQAGQFTDNLFFLQCPACVIIDTAVILDAPVVWLEAGLGDTLAKMYELRAASSVMEATSLTIAAVMNGQICYEIISLFGNAAREAVARQEGTAAFAAAVDAIILSAGMSSIFGGTDLRNAAAHAFYNGFTKIPATHATAHGLIVGYGNLCLLALEGRSDEELLAEIELAQRCGIPVTLSQIAELTSEEIQLGAEAAVKTAAMKCMPFAVTAEMVINAINRVDNMAENNKNV